MSEAGNTDLAEILRDIRVRLTFLKEIGVESLDVLPTKGVPVSSSDVPLQAAPDERRVVTAPTPSGQQPRPTITDRNLASTETAVKPAGSRLAQLPSLKARKPSQFFDKYNPRDENARDKNQIVPAVRSIEVVPERADITESIAEIHAEIGPECTRCKLCGLGRTQVVNSVGSVEAQLMFCGEAPGADEDKFGEPFVGRAGQLLTDIIEKGLEISRKDVFIGNINRCRPPGNRAPEPDESAACKPFLLREIAVVRPKVIVVLGATAAQNLLETKTPISKLRGRFHDHHGTKVMPTFHPAYLLRDPNKKRDVWEDMKLVKEYLRGL